MLGYFQVTAGPIDTASTTSGKLMWTFDSGSEAFDFLAAGETLTLHYTIRPDDGHLQTGTGDGVVTIIISGTNDAPVITGGATGVDYLGALPGTAQIAATGVLDFTDTDLTDFHTVHQTLASATWSGGAVIPSATAAAVGNAFAVVLGSDSTGSGDGKLDWSFGLGSNLTTFIAEGETLTLVYNVTVTDNLGTNSTQPVTITFAGTNDAPVVTAGNGDSAGQTLEETNAGLHASGTLTATDVDVTDVVSVSVLGSGLTHTGPTGGLTDVDLLSYFHVTTGSIDTASTTSGKLMWTFDSGSEAFDFLAAGETLTLHYTIRPDDGHLQTGTGDGVVTIIITGTNDAPVVTSSTNGTVVESSDRPLSFATGLGPLNVAIGDLNGDGRPDIVTSDNLANSASVLLGNGDGTFSSRSDYAVGNLPRAIALADLNDDGKLDLIVGNQYQDSISILVGNGDGTFQSQVQYAAGANPWSLTTADLNGDGNVDIVAADESSDSIAVLLGNGDGTFGSTTSYAAGPIPFGVAVADLNGDGRPDVVTTNINARTVSVMLGNGDGSFQAPSASYSVGLTPEAIAIGDVNGDGKLDLVVTNSDQYNAGPGSNSVLVLLGNGDGTFQPQTTFATGLAPTTVLLRDVNGDGKLDIITANTASNDISVLFGNGQGAFETHVDYAMGTAPGGVAVADLNGDGQPDFVTANTGGNNISVLLNLGGLTTAGTISFTDADLSDSHTASFVAAVTNSTSLGTFSLDLVNEASGAADGAVAWHYTLDIAAAQYLAEGLTVTETYTVTIDDGHGGRTTQDIAVSIIGTNDAPTIVAGATTAAGAISELANTTGSGALDSASGTIAFADIDLTDMHTAIPSFVSAVWHKNGGAMEYIADPGAITLGALNDTAKTVGWSYAAADSALDFLSQGESLTITYNVTVNDNHGGAVTQPVRVTITGANDIAAVTSQSRSVFEGDTALALNTAGQLTITDPDSGEAHVQPLNIHGAYGDFTIDANGAWTYLGNGAHNELVAWQQVSDTFTVLSSDGTSAGTVVVNITGTNDAPVIYGEPYTATISENNASGQILAIVRASDADANDTIHYNIAGGDPGGWFAIDEHTGVLTANHSFDFEADPHTFALQIEARDSTGPSLADMTTVGITILDQPEHALVDFTPDAEAIYKDVRTFDFSHWATVTSGSGDDTRVDTAWVPMSYNAAETYIENGIQFQEHYKGVDIFQSGGDWLMQAHGYSWNSAAFPNGGWWIPDIPQDAHYEISRTDGGLFQINYVVAFAPVGGVHLHDVDNNQDIYIHEGYNEIASGTHPTHKITIDAGPGQAQWFSSMDFLML